MTIETKYNIGDEVWWKKYPNIRHGKVYGVWVEHRIAKILKELALGLDKAIRQLKIQQLQMDDGLERMKLLMNYENKDN